VLRDRGSRTLAGMALTTVPTTRPGSRTTQEATRAAVKELQGLKQVVVAGAGANADIAIAGISTVDKLVGVVEVPASAALVDRTAIASITSAGNIRLTASTAGNQLLVTYIDIG
jgi:hypothetical protein